MPDIFKQSEIDNKKQCSACKKWLELNSFYKTNTGTSVAACKECKLKKSADAHLMKCFGITREEYLNMSEAQNHLCAICNQPEKTINNRANKIQQLSIDHCHITGRIRKLLCSRCNLTLGNISDNIEILENAIKYLLEFKIQ
jgi:hypothetical protein